MIVMSRGNAEEDGPSAPTSTLLIRGFAPVPNAPICTFWLPWGMPMEENVSPRRSSTRRLLKLADEGIAVIWEAPAGHPAKLATADTQMVWVPANTAFGS
jgi:hypothetical protein